MSLRTQGAVSGLPLLPLAAPLCSPLPIIPPLLWVSLWMPPVQWMPHSTESSAVPLPGSNKASFWRGEEKAFPPAPCLPSLHGNVGELSLGHSLKGWEQAGGFVEGTHGDKGGASIGRVVLGSGTLGVNVWPWEPSVCRVKKTGASQSDFHPAPRGVRFKTYFWLASDAVTHIF